MQLLSPVPPPPKRTSYRNQRGSERKRVPRSAIKSLQRPTPSMSTSSASIGRRTRSRRKQAAKRAVLDTPTAASNEISQTRDVLSRLTDKSRFTGTSRFQRPRKSSMEESTSPVRTPSKSTDNENNMNVENENENVDVHAGDSHQSDGTYKPKPNASVAWDAFKVGQCLHVEYLIPRF